MRTVAFAAALLLSACASPVARTRPASSVALRAKPVPGTEFRDTAVVRRLCVAPDSVLAGRKACELRNQAAFRVF